MQLVEGDTYAYLSSCTTNSIIKINISSGDTIRTLCGASGDFKIKDFDGTWHPAGASLWFGQHK